MRPGQFLNKNEDSKTETETEENHLDPAGIELFWSLMCYAEAPHLKATSKTQVT